MSRREMLGDLENLSRAINALQATAVSQAAGYSSLRSALARSRSAAEREGGQERRERDKASTLVADLRRIETLIGPLLSKLQSEATEILTFAEQCKSSIEASIKQGEAEEQDLSTLLTKLDEFKRAVEELLPKLASEAKEFTSAGTDLRNIENLAGALLSQVTLPKEEQLKLSEQSFAALLGTKNHLQDSGSRILAAIAFLTTAAAAIYREARVIHDANECLQQWATLWFGIYLACVSLGALFLLGALWSPLWKHREPPADAAGHSLLYFAAASPQARVDSYNGLLAAYAGEREPLIREGKSVSRMFQAGGALLCGAFFFFLALAANLFTTADIRSGSPLLVILVMLGFTLLYGQKVREKHNGSPDWKLLASPEWKFWPDLWRALIVISAVLLVVVWWGGSTFQDEVARLCPGWDRPIVR